MNMIEKALMTRKRATRKSAWQKPISFGASKADIERLDKLVAYHRVDYPGMHRSGLIRFLLIQEEQRIKEES